MAECPICRRSYDARFQVFIPPHREAFDSVACARRGAEVWGWDKATPAAIVLPPVTAAAAPAPAPTFAGARHKKKRVAALAALAVAPGQAALATGVGLLAAGSAASIYLWAKPAGNATPVAVSVHHPRPTLSPRPTATLPSTPLPSTPLPVKHPTKQPKVAVTKRAHRTPTPAGTRRVSPQSNSQSPELISRPVAVPTPKPKPTTAKAPTATPKTPASPPAKAPPPTKAPTPKPPAGGDGGITSAAVPAPQTLRTSSSKSKKPKPTTPPPAAPPPTTPPPPTTTDEDCTPGNGWGDKNHVHCGAPGQDDQGENSDAQGAENNDGDPGNNGHGHDGDHGNGGGNGHGHGH